MKRQIIRIDETLCDGCGICAGGCPEGAIQMIDNKARLVNELFCDGLGACIGECPQGAITIEEREAEAYDEWKTMDNIVEKGPATIRAHLEHLRDHGQTTYLKQGMEYLKAHDLKVPMEAAKPDVSACGCPGSKNIEMALGTDDVAVGEAPSRLTHWPVQLHLASPQASQFHGAELLLAADCTAFAMGSFHETMLKGRKVVIACPKLDQGTQIYVDKLVSLVDDARVNTITVAMMTVPCCGGLLGLVREALGRTERQVPVKAVVISPEGKIVQDEWVKMA